MRKRVKTGLAFLLMVLAAVFMLAGCSAVSSGQGQTESAAAQDSVRQEEIYTESAPAAEQTQADTIAGQSGQISEDGSYTSRDDVALYIHTYGHLPDNFITKKEAQKAGWDSQEGNLQDVLPGMSIVVDRFGNYEGALPEEDGRKYFECDIDYQGGYRSSKRIVYSNDGLVFYTEDHYKNFEQLY